MFHRLRPRRCDHRVERRDVDLDSDDQRFQLGLPIGDVANNFLSHAYCYFVGYRFWIGDSHSIGYRLGIRCRWWRGHDLTRGRC